MSTPAGPTGFRLTDSTLRDGSHAIAHQFTEAQVRAVVRALDRAGVPVIEVSHGDGLGGSSFNYGFSHTDERELLAAGVEERRNARLAVLLLPGIGIANDLVGCAQMGVDIARIATHCTEADISAQHIAMARSLGMEVVGFLMMAHMLSPLQLAEQGKLMESYGADCVYVVDSAGAVANSMAALEEGVDQLDGCTTGLGAGAGNCPTEVLVAACEKTGVSTGVDLLQMMDAAEEVVRPIHPPMGVIDRDGLMLGYAGVYGSFLLHAKRAAARFGVDSKQILLELGKRGVVGGQEDMIIDVALEISEEGAG